MDDKERWQAVCTRDAAADGIFVFAVTTTGVYCRPSCPARRPRRENVRFFALDREAETAGFRPCRRCRPHELSTAQRHALLIEAACRQIAASEQEPTLAELADAAGLSPSHFHRLFRAVVGVTPKHYARTARAAALRHKVRTAPSVTAAAFDSGHESLRRFYDRALAALGMTPRAFRAGAAGEVILFSSAPSTLGVVTVAFTRRGVCAVRLDDRAEEGEAELRALFPKAHLVPAADDLDALVSQVVSAIEEPARAPELPLDIRGTAFEQRVWRALRDIPAGETASYSGIAGRVGAPRAQRAVARACGANPVAVLVPCHRVVRADGGLGGYRWGIARKERLLAREGAGRPSGKGQEDP